MKPELQRIAIAELCGVPICPDCNHLIDPECCHCGSPMKSHGYQDGHSGIPMGCTCGYHEAEKMKAVEPECPDYLNDLNAMHEAEKTLKWERNSDTVNESYYSQQMRYSSKLCNVVSPGESGFGAANIYPFINTTAAQRAEAFLRTLGKWVES